MKTCKNCYWRDHCKTGEDFKNQRCEDYDPVFSSDGVVAREYEEALIERVREYQSIVDEMKD